MFALTQNKRQNKRVSIGLLALALCIATLFIALGMWQLDRAEQKRILLEEFVQHSNASSLDLNQPDLRDPTELSGYLASGAGHYVGDSILLDNQLVRGRAGYFVYSAFKLNGHKESILVNRGWIVAGADRSHVPRLATSTLNQRLNGRLSPPPVAGLRLAGSELIEFMAQQSWRVQTIDFSALSIFFDLELLPITLLLDDDSESGYVREWLPPGSDEARHLGYAFQWFAMSATVIVVSSILTLRANKVESA